MGRRIFCSLCFVFLVILCGSLLVPFYLLESRISSQDLGQFPHEHQEEQELLNLLPLPFPGSHHRTSTLHRWLIQRPLTPPQVQREILQEGSLLESTSHNQSSTYRNIFPTAQGNTKDSSKQLDSVKLPNAISNQSSYLLSLGYSEQISAATHSVLQLGTLAYDLGADLVEPTVVSSHLFGIRGVYPPFIDAGLLDMDEVNLFYIYNLSKVNEVLHSSVSPSVNMVPFQDFLNNAPHEIVLFHVNTRSLDKAKRLFALSRDEVAFIDSAFKKNPEEQVFDCLTRNMTVMNIYIDKIEKQLNSWGGERQFSVVQALCLNPEYVYRSVYLSYYVSSPRTVIFTNWGGCAFRDCSYQTEENLFRTRRNITRKTRLKHAILTKKRFKFNIYEEHKLHHDRLHGLAFKYLRLLNFTSSPFIAVHIRMERIIRRAMESQAQNYYIKCLANLLSVVNYILNGNDKPRHFRGSQEVLVISDKPGSEYGSDSCSGRFCNEEEIRKLLSAFSVAFDIQSFRPRIVESVANSGVVSLVEMHMLSMGEKLVLVGFGGFQAVLQNLFLSHGHSSKDIHHVACE